MERISAAAMSAPDKPSHRLSRVVAIAVAVAVPSALILAVAGPAMLGLGPTIHHPIVASPQTVGATGKVIRVELPLGPETDLNVNVGDTVAVHLHKDGALNSAWGGPFYSAGQGLGEGATLAPEVSFPGNPTPTERDRYFAFRMAGAGEVGIGFMFPTSCTPPQPCPAPAAFLRLHITGSDASPACMSKTAVPLAPSIARRGILDITNADNHQTVTAHVGDEVRVRIVRDTACFHWGAVFFDRALLTGLNGGASISPPPGRPRPGEDLPGAGVQTADGGLLALLHADRPGRTDLRAQEVVDCPPQVPNINNPGGHLVVTSCDGITFDFIVTIVIAP